MVLATQGSFWLLVLFTLVAHLKQRLFCAHILTKLYEAATNENQNKFYECTFKAQKLGRGGGQMVSVLTFYSDDSSSNPAEAYSFL